ncbi:hypothetical protein [Geoglobus acetivorans]|uniref:Cytochrome c family protein n=1 Tax=Geoglobus acetivorans TaxID=565033 RepID=A0ABZ3H3E8_GEOAI|nr:hypothetical protein [Geoglobus acetivorans]
MMQKLMMLAILIFSLSIYLLPSTVTLFTGQHLWYNLEQPGTGVPCIKCHADIYDELNNSVYHKIWGDSTKADDQDCYTCHTINQSITYADADQGIIGQEAHAASTISCGYCHFNSSIMTAMGGLVAGGFNKSDLPGDTGEVEAHRKFLEDAMLDDPLYGSDLLEKENEACISCHTAVAVKIHFAHREKLNFRAEKNSNGLWNHPSFGSTGFVNTTVWGNAMATGGLYNNSTATKTWGDGTWS